MVSGQPEGGLSELHRFLDATFIEPVEIVSSEEDRQRIFSTRGESSSGESESSPQAVTPSTRRELDITQRVTQRSIQAYRPARTVRATNRS